MSGRWLMRIKKGDVLVHKLTGMRATAAADEGGDGVVLLSLQGLFVPYQAREWARVGERRDHGGPGQADQPPCQKVERMLID
jgi:hypothetical protein